MINKLILFLILFFSFPTFSNESITNIKEKQPIFLNNVPNGQFVNFAKIQILDKIMAKTYELEVKIGKETIFNKLLITPYKCWKSNPEDRPENKILIIINEIKQDKKEKIFSGWMLSSSPSISSMEHPIYDLTLIKCFNNSEDE